MIGMSSFSYINSPSVATKSASFSGQSIIRILLSVGEALGESEGYAEGEFVGDTLSVGVSDGVLLG